MLFLEMISQNCQFENAPNYNQAVVKTEFVKK